METGHAWVAEDRKHSATLWVMVGDPGYIEMDRSYDAGDFWISPFNVIEGTRQTTTPPDLP